MLQITEDYRIRKYDDFNIVLEKRKIVGEGVAGQVSKNVGKEKWEILTYHSDIRAAFKKYATGETNNAKSFQDLLERMDRIDDKIDELLTLKHDI